MYSSYTATAAITSIAAGSWYFSRYRSFLSFNRAFYTSQLSQLTKKEILVYCYS